MAINKRLLVKPLSTGITPSEHFGVVLYEGDGASGHSINGGKFGAGAYFDGSSSQITTSNDIPLEGEFAISLWLRQDAADHSGNGSLFDFGYNSSPYMFAWIDNGTIRFDDNTAPTGRYSYSTATTSNAWNHIVITRNSSNTTSFYLNGSLDGTSSNFTQDVSHPFTIGYSPIRNGGAGDRLGGKVDQVRIFSKGLSSSEVSTLYAETATTVESLDPLSEDTTDTLQVLGDSSCIATYRFENDETDLSGNFNGTGTAIQYAAGRYGQSASFNGTSSKVDITATASTPIDFSQRTFTISAWINGSGFTTDDRTIISKYNGSNNTGSSFFFDVRDSDQKLRVTEVNGTSALGFQSGGSISENTWTHVVYVRTSTTCEFFINGSSSGGSQSRTTALNAGGTTDISIGERQANKRFIGKIDQVRIFNKALSASEVTTLYQENSLVASYRFEGNANDDMRAYDGTASNVTYEYGLGFTPDFVWAKHRNHATAHSHNWADSTRGGTKIIYANTNDAQQTISTSIQTFDTGGFTVGNSAAVNDNGIDYVAWCFKANGGTTTSVTGTNISSATQQVNTDIDFSITQFTEGSSGTSAVPHGLSGTPDMYIVKRTGGAQDWYVWHNGLSAGNSYIILNSNAAQGSNNNMWTQVDSTNINLGAWNTEGGGTKIVYAFKNVDSFSKFGGYTGNGDANGPIIETGFEPA
ncbi:MAG: LamG domain-containing protein, partial [Flavobacteriales bacterium]|nr:LamG domain-containing protein [Flavobacteriales bacterium]